MTTRAEASEVIVDPDAEAAAQSAQRVEKRRRRWGCSLYAAVAVLLPLVTLVVIYLVFDWIGSSRAAEMRQRAVAAGDPLTKEEIQNAFYPPSAEVDLATEHWRHAAEARHEADEGPRFKDVPLLMAPSYLFERDDRGFFTEPTLQIIDEYMAGHGEEAIESAHAARRAGAVARFASDLEPQGVVLGGTEDYPWFAGDSLQSLRHVSNLLELDLERRAARGEWEAAVEISLSQAAASEACSHDPTALGCAVQLALYGVAHKNLRRLLRWADLSDDQLRRLDAAFARPDFHARLIGLVQADQYRVVRALETEEPTYDETLDVLRRLPHRGADEAIALERFQDFLDGAKTDFDGARRENDRLEAILSEYEDDWAVTLLPHGTMIIKTAEIPSHVARASIMRAQQTLIRAGIACELYRLKHGVWPQSLEALVPEFLAEVPVDVYDGQLIRFETQGDRLALHSVGQLDDRYKNLEFDDGPLTFVIEKPQRP
jgi:hypothetical protein